MTHEVSQEQQLQAATVHTVFAALGGIQVYGYEGTGGITMDDTSSVRQTRRHIDADGRRWLYTTNVTVSVSRTEITP